MRTAAFGIVWTIALTVAVWLYWDLGQPIAIETDDPVAAVGSVKGSAKRKHPRQFLWQEATVGATLPSGAIVATGSKSRMVVRLRSGVVIDLAENSQVELGDVSDGRQLLTVFRGKAQIDAKNSRRIGLVVQSLSYTAMATRGSVLTVTSDVERGTVRLKVQGKRGVVLDGRGRRVGLLTAAEQTFSTRREVAARPKEQPPAPLVLPPVSSAPAATLSAKALPPKATPAPGQFFWNGRGDAEPFAINLQHTRGDEQVEFMGVSLQKSGGVWRIPANALRRRPAAGMLAVRMDGRIHKLGQYSFVTPRNVDRGSALHLQSKSGSGWAAASPGSFRLFARQVAIGDLMRRFDLVGSSPHTGRPRGTFFVSRTKIIAEAYGTVSDSDAEWLKTVTGSVLAFDGARSAWLTGAALDAAFIRRDAKLYFAVGKVLVPVDWQLLTDQPGTEQVIRQNRMFFREKVTLR